jgi:hypothetical protein
MGGFLAANRTRALKRPHLLRILLGSGVGSLSHPGIFATLEKRGKRGFDPVIATKGESAS